MWRKCAICHGNLVFGLRTHQKTRSNRHPLANALAHRPFLTGRRSIGDLMANWLAVAEYIEQDMPHLQNKLLLKLEDLVADPDGQLSKVQAHTQDSRVQQSSSA